MYVIIIRFTTCIILLAIISPLIIADDPCRFQTSNGVIDISSLAHTDGTPAFPDKVPPGGSNYKYSYNPCRPFTEGSQCQNVSVCQASMDGQYQFTLGLQESATWSAGSGPGSNHIISYSYGTKTVHFELVCSIDIPDNVEALGEGSIETYLFRLTSKCACPNGCQGPTTITTTTTTNATTTTTTTKTMTATTTTTAPVCDGNCVFGKATVFKIIGASISLYLATQYQQ